MRTVKEFSKDRAFEEFAVGLAIVGLVATILILSCGQRVAATTDEARAQGALKFYSDKSAELEGYIRGARATGALPSPMAGDAK
mgnify:CR=1 FL=1